MWYTQKDICKKNYIKEKICEIHLPNEQVCDLAIEGLDVQCICSININL